MSPSIGTIPPVVKVVASTTQTQRAAMSAFMLRIAAAKIDTHALTVTPEQYVAECQRRTGSRSVSATASGPVCLDARLPEPNLADADLDAIEADDSRTWRSRR
jgi:hypothetical protein